MKRFICALALTMAGCAHIKPIAIGMAKCVLGQVPSAVAGIVPNVTAVLGGTDVDWGQQLTAIGSRAGVDALACAISSIVGEIKIAKKAALDPVAVRKMERGEMYLAAHPVK